MFELICDSHGASLYLQAFIDRNKKELTKSLTKKEIQVEDLTDSKGVDRSKRKSVYAKQAAATA